MTVWMLMGALAWSVEPGVDVVEDEAVEDAVQLPDRSSPPPVLPPERLPLLEPETHALMPGVDVRVVTIQGVRSVSIEAILHRGSHDLVGGPTEEALALGRHMSVATRTRDASTLSILQDMHEVEIYGWLGHHRGGVSLSCPKSELELGTELLGEVLREPAFPKADLKRGQRFRELFYTVDGPANLGRASQMAVSYGWFPADHPYGARPVLDDVRKVSVKDLHALHQSWLEISPMTVLVVGDVTWDEVKPLLETALQGLGVEGEQKPDLPIEEPTGIRVIGIDGPGETQARIRLRVAAPWRDAEDRVAADMMVWAFGGHFLSRLNRNLREDKGFTYGSRARYSTAETRGHVTVSVDVKAENVEATIREITAEMNALVEQGVTEDELGAAALEKISSWNNVKESARTAGWFYSGLLRSGETVADAEARGRKTLDVTAEDARAVAEARLGEEGTRLWVIAGDRQVLDPQLAALGFEVEWITPEQAVLGTF